MSEKKDTVGIKINRETRDKLKAIGMKGDTYEDVICDLLDIDRVYRAGGEK